jgi:hypothetical protein
MDTREFWIDNMLRIAEPVFARRWAERRGVISR